MNRRLLMLFRPSPTLNLRKLGASLLIGVLLAFVASTVSADEPTKQREFVYGLNLFNGVDFSTGFIPKYVDTIYVLADSQSTIDPKRTDVYWWPLTNEYKGDFATVDEIVTSTLEISQGGKMIATQPMVDYVIQFDHNGGIGNGKLYVGEEAHQRQDLFLQQRQDYLKRLGDYSDAQNAYTTKIDELRKLADAGQQVTIPDPPNQPGDFTLYSTDIVHGFPIRLPPGEYQIHVKDPTGAIVPDSEKRLVSISPRREGIGYQVVPQDKWTTPSQADDPSNAIYTVPGGTVYLEPFDTKEYNALQYGRLENPQDLQETANNWTWVHTGSLADLTMKVQHDGQTETLPLNPFAVQQTQDASLGYYVVPFVRNPSDPPPGSLGAPSPDFVAFKITAPERRTIYTVSMVDKDGHDVAGSVRQIIVNPPLALWQLGLPVLLPLLVGLTVILWRREQVVTRRSLPLEKRILVN